MKNKKTFFICIFPLAFIAVLLIIFSVLGSIYRTGYLNEIKLIENNVYSFRISYYNKVFRNSDIYDVYLDTKTTINDNIFIKNIKMDKKGSPFGTLITDKTIDVNKKIDNVKYTLKIKNIIYIDVNKKIDNVKYTLKIKNIIYFYAFIIYILIFTFLFFFKNIKNILEIFINFIIVNKKTAMPVLVISSIFIILLLSLIILGSINRTGYLNEIKLIKNNVYSFRISYYNKVFRNSDIYNVYLDTQRTIDDNRFIKNIKMEKAGSPFGTLI